MAVTDLICESNISVFFPTLMKLLSSLDPVSNENHHCLVKRIKDPLCDAAVLDNSGLAASASQSKHTSDSAHFVLFPPRF